MTRLVPVTVLVVMLAASRIAAADADSTALDDMGTLSFSELKIHENNSSTAEFPEKDPDSKWHYMNLAHCQCAAPGVSPRTDYNEKNFQYLITAMNSTNSTRTVELWVGADCKTDTTRPLQCRKIGDAGSVADIRGNNDTRVEVSVFDLMVPTPNPTVAQCETTSPGQGTDTLWMMVDIDGDGTLDYPVAQAIATDTGPPPLPTNFRADGTEGGIRLSWTPPTDSSDVYAYQALCAPADSDEPLGKSFDALYDTAAQLCGASIETKLTAVDIPGATDGVDAGAAVTLPAAMRTLDPRYLCGETVSAATSGFTIDGLTDGKAYRVALLSMDKFGNATGVYFTSTITPVPSTDFWEDLQGQGSDVEGGLCLLAETYGDDSSLTGMLRSFRDDTLGDSAIGRGLARAYYATLGKLGFLVHGSWIARGIAGVVLAPLVAIALLWHWLTLPGLLGLIAIGWILRRRRWRLPRLAYAAPAIALIAVAPQLAHAGGYQPYWENGDIATENNDTPPDDPSLVKWHVGVRVGPYIPDIDKRFAAKPGPFEQMFGGYHMLVMLDVDRVIWSGYGQVAVGLSAGYWQKRARAWQLGSSPDDPMRPRASDENKFRMVPTALTLAYRFTVLDDEYGIPVVPYVRGGLSYYLWWISTANGNFATACKDGTATPGCDETRALGGTLGVQGAIGLAIRAERIDASTANSMRQSGIQHAGIYGELSIGKVDGFGSESKLSVGDKTWFAGVDFEF